MRIAVYCGSSPGTDPAFAKLAVEIGERIAAEGFTLVFGGSDAGLMGYVSNAALRAGGRVTGVVPRLERIWVRRHPGLTETVPAKDMAERRSIMISLADAFIALPGGIGTLDELSEVLCLKSLGVISGPVVLADPGSFWQPFTEMCAKMCDCGLMPPAVAENLLVSGDTDEIFNYIKQKTGGQHGK